MANIDKIMFEIFRVDGASREFRTVYFTELEEHDREEGINQALAGEHVFDGFIAQRNVDQAKAAITSLMERLNQGEELDHRQVETILAAHLVS